MTWASLSVSIDWGLRTKPGSDLSSSPSFSGTKKNDRQDVPTFQAIIIASLDATGATDSTMPFVCNLCTYPHKPLYNIGYTPMLDCFW